MELHARLVHAEAGLRVVEVRASRGGHSLGSALAEAATAQQAEDLALRRLLQRLETAGPAPAALAPGPLPLPEPQPSESPLSPPSLSGPSLGEPTLPPPGLVEPSLSRPLRNRSAPNPPAADGAGDNAGAPPPRRSAQPSQQSLSWPDAAEPDSPLPEPSSDASAQSERPPQAAGPAPFEPNSTELHDHTEEEPPADPEDWSQELTAVDLELRRLGWSREQEGLYLQRVFGHPSRSRLTRYSDLRAYLVALEGLERGSDPAAAAVPLRRSELLAQGDLLLSRLGWSAEQGRAFLERELQRISRQQLSDAQLLQFNMLLEEALLERETTGMVPAQEGQQR